MRSTQSAPREAPLPADAVTRSDLGTASAAPILIGRSASFCEAVALVDRMARFEAPVLIRGETGTGKELAARAIHYRSARRDAPFVPLNCGAVPDALIESELFGCERGAYTDARYARSGLAAAADGGTLFLDEVDALSTRAQVALLRFLQEHVYRPIGSTREQHSDVRLIAAASPRLGGLVRDGEFREDLLFRLNVLPLDMPPLRLRPGDARLLAEHFIARHARRCGVTARAMDNASCGWVDSYAWPGNVREVDTLVQRALFLSDGEWLNLVGFAGAIDHAEPELAEENAAAGPLPGFNVARASALSRFEKRYLEQLMTVAQGNVTHAARLAGKERRSLGKLLKRHGIEPVRTKCG